MWVYVIGFFIVATILNIIASILVIKALKQKGETEPPIKPKQEKPHFSENLPKADSIESELTGVTLAVISAEKLREKVANATGDTKKVKETPKKPETVIPKTKEECESQGGKWEDGTCVIPKEEKSETLETERSSEET